MRQLHLGAGDHEEVALVVDLDDAVARLDRLEDLLHLAGSDVLERDDQHLKTAVAEQAHVRADGARQGLALGNDLVQVVRPDQHRPLHAQQRLQRRNQAVARERRARLQIDLALDLLVDGVIQLEDVAEYALDHLVDVRALEVERDVAAVPDRVGRAARRLLIDERAAAAEQFPRRRLGPRLVKADVVVAPEHVGLCRRGASRLLARLRRRRGPLARRRRGGGGAARRERGREDHQETHVAVKGSHYITSSSPPARATRRGAAVLAPAGAAAFRGSPRPCRR